MAQFGTWAIGRLTTRQDMAKVQPTIKALDPVHVDKIMEELPAQKPGQFILISPDNFKNTHRLQTRWLLTEHRTLNDEDIEQLAIQRWHDRFEPLEAAQGDLHAAGLEAAQQESAAPDKSQKRQRGLETPAAPAAQQHPAIEEEAEEEAEAESDDPGAPNEELISMDNRLSRRPSASAAEFALLAKISEGQARSVLRKLCEAGLARMFKAGRVQRYWSLSTGLRLTWGWTSP